MKFGKRLAAEAARRWRPYYLDYKACKRAIQQDVHANGAQGPATAVCQAPACFVVFPSSSTAARLRSVAISSGYGAAGARLTGPLRCRPARAQL